ncbi:MAG: DUF3459 domain-containing protein [Myxococcota bacterium]
MKNARLSFGITREQDLFRARYWFPAVRDAALRFRNGTVLPLHRNENGFFEGHFDEAPHPRYRLSLDGVDAPDPFARWLPEGVDGDPAVLDSATLRFRHPPVSRPIEDVVILEVHVGCATPAGTFRALMGELPRYRDLGITALELLPVNQFGGEFGWGYDGVFFFAPHHAYGSPEDLAALVDDAHRLGLMIFNDVVYNHLGPIGNPWPRSCPAFERSDHSTPWGPTPDFRETPVREMVIGNVLEWLELYRFDGLRFDAVHTLIDEGQPHILEEIADAIRHGPGREREIHLVLENDDNEISRLRRPDGKVFDAQWNDDLHHALHVAATGEDGHYYRDFQSEPLVQVGRCLTGSFAFHGEYSHHRGRARGERWSNASPFAFCNFAQNHDQVGNRGLGDRLNVSHGADIHWLCAFIAWLAPGIPMLWMGEESGTRRDFPFFGDYPTSLADAVREGRKRDHQGLPGFDGPVTDPVSRQTFLAAKLPGGVEDENHASRVKAWLEIRRRELVPRYRKMDELSGEFSVEGKLLQVRWRVPDDEGLRLVANFSEAPALVELPGRVLASTHNLADRTQMPETSCKLPGWCAVLEENLR